MIHLACLSRVPPQVPVLDPCSSRSKRRRHRRKRRPRKMLKMQRNKTHRPLHRILPRPKSQKEHLRMCLWRRSRVLRILLEISSQRKTQTPQLWSSSWTLSIRFAQHSTSPYPVSLEVPQKSTKKTMGGSDDVSWQCLIYVYLCRGCRCFVLLPHRLLPLAPAETTVRRSSQRSQRRGFRRWFWHLCQWLLRPTSRGHAQT